jgi:hypothetical protein
VTREYEKERLDLIGSESHRYALLLWAPNLASHFRVKVLPQGWGATGWKITDDRDFPVRDIK